MNKFNADAAWEGREFIRNNPNATGVDIDNAATKHCPFDPARRHFQQAAYEELAVICDPVEIAEAHLKSMGIAT